MMYLWLCALYFYNSSQYIGFRIGQWIIISGSTDSILNILLNRSE